MTHLIIHNNINIQEQYLLNLASKILEREFSSLESLIQNPDIHHLTITEKKGIGIEEVKNLQQKVRFQPFQEVKQIGIVFYAQALTVQAQNAFLKTLEEVSPTTAFILLTNNEKNLLQTIVSRSIKHYAHGQEQEEVGEKPEILKLEIHEQFKQIEDISKEGDPLELIDQIIKYFRVKLKETIKQNDTEAMNLVNDNLKHINTAKQRLKANGNKRLVLENLMLQISSLD